MVCMCDPQLCLKRNSYELILLNFHVTATGGSLFLFDRKVLRYFRKDGHNWRKKKDGKTVKEAHEKLKVSKYWLFSSKSYVNIFGTSIYSSDCG